MNQQNPAQNSGLNNNPISPNLSDNLEQISKVFANCKDLVNYHWSYGPDLAHKACSVYFTTLILNKEHNYMKESLQDLVAHEVGPGTMVTPEDFMCFFGQRGVSSQSATLIETMNQAVQDITEGNVVIFINQWDKALSYKAIGIETRQFSEPINEPVVHGPHFSLIENLQKNIGVIRSLLKSPHFKVELLTAGKEVKRTIAYSYIEGAVNPETLTEFTKRIQGIEKFEIMETSFVEEWLEDSIYSPFPQFRYTERPDTIVAALLDGKIAVMVDGTPMTMICPGLFVEFFSTSEDYYLRTVYSSLIRLLRVTAFFLALTLPSIYIALSTFHTELIPTVLLLAIVDTREGTPFPAVIEALIMEMLFELLREAGIRLPRPIGSTVSIVGALVIGQAAIQAKIASPFMVIIVSLTGIASFSMPHYHMAATLRILRFPLMLLAASLGGFGLMIGFLLILLHLTTLRSLGVPYMAPLAPLRFIQLRDVFIRAPLKVLLRFPRNRLAHNYRKNMQPVLQRERNEQ